MYGGRWLGQLSRETVKSPARVDKAEYHISLAYRPDTKFKLAHGQENRNERLDSLDRSDLLVGARGMDIF